MNYELRDLLEKASIRNESIPRMLEEKSVYRPGNPVARLVTTFGWRLLLRRRNVSGKENLENAISVASEKNEDLTFAGPHKSDIDTQFVEQGLRLEGRWGFANRLVYIAGLNMNERTYIRVNTLGGNRIFVETPLIMDDLKTITSTGTDSPTQDILEEFLRNGKSLNRTALEEAINARRRGQCLFVYPESTRSPDGFIKKAHPDTNAYFSRGIILPMMIRGSEEFLPPKVKLTVRKVISMLRDGGFVDLEYGIPFSARGISTREVRAELRQMQATPVDLVMARIGRMDWDRVDPSLRPWYQELDEKFPTIPLAA